MKHPSVAPTKPSSFSEKAKEVISWVGAAVFGVLGWNAVETLSGGIAAKVAGVIAGAAIGKHLTKSALP